MPLSEERSSTWQR